MKAIMWENRELIAYAIGAVIFAIAEWKTAKGHLLELMLHAKDMAKDEVLNGGLKQKQWVIKTAKARYKYINLIPDSILELIVEKIYVAAMDKFDDGIINGSYNGITGEGEE